MVNALWFFPYVIAGGVMWLLAYQLAPIGREIPLGRAILTVVLLGVCGVLSSKFLGPLIGKGWLIPLDFVASTLVVKVGAGPDFSAFIGRGAGLLAGLDCRDRGRFILREGSCARAKSSADALHGCIVDTRALGDTVAPPEIALNAVISFRLV